MSCYKSSSELVNVVFHRWLNSAHIPLRIWETTLKNYNNKNNKINMNIDAQHICRSCCPDYYSIGGRLCTFSMPLSLSFLSLSARLIETACIVQPTTRLHSNCMPIRPCKSFSLSSRFYFQFCFFLFFRYLVFFSAMAQFRCCCPVTPADSDDICKYILNGRKPCLNEALHHRSRSCHSGGEWKFIPARKQ